MQPNDSARQRQAKLILVTGASLVILVVAISGVLAAHQLTDPDQARHAQPLAAAQKPSPAQQPNASRARTRSTAATRWNVAAQNALARRPMLRFPTQAALPHQLFSRSAGPPIRLPEPTQVRGVWVDQGFPPTPQGALAQLVALSETGMDGLDPAVYARAYRSIALPGAPKPASTVLYRNAAATREAAGIAPTGPVNGFRGRYNVVQGLIKGTTDGGRFVVACVLGVYEASAEETARAGLGDCQALRWVNGDWRISPTALPYPAPSAWPGSKEAFKAGYREVR